MDIVSVLLVVDVRRFQDPPSILFIVLDWVYGFYYCFTVLNRCQVLDFACTS